MWNRHFNNFLIFLMKMYRYMYQNSIKSFVVCNYSFHLLKGVSHEIFDLQFFSWFKPNWAPDKQAKAFSNSVSISLRYSNF